MSTNRLGMLSGVAVFSAIAFATAARVQRPVDDPLACPWDIKICVDGTWVYREPERQCAFRECWSSYKPPATTRPPLIRDMDTTKPHS